MAQGRHRGEHRVRGAGHRDRGGDAADAEHHPDQHRRRRGVRRGPRDLRHPPRARRRRVDMLRVEPMVGPRLDITQDAVLGDAHRAEPRARQGRRRDRHALQALPTLPIRHVLVLLRRVQRRDVGLPHGHRSRIGAVNRHARVGRSHHPELQ